MPVIDAIEIYETHHITEKSDSGILLEARKRLELSGKSHLIPTLEALKNSLLFRHVLRNQGLSGEGIDYVFQILEGQVDRNESPLTDADIPFLDLPVVKATQQRFQIFQDSLTKLLTFYDKDEPVTICSIPCGFMRDLFSFQSSRKNLTFVGIDKDPRSLKIAKEKMQTYSSFPHTFLERDALALEDFKPVDIALSNGFNFYLDDAKVKTFNFELAKLIKPSGYLIISHITSLEEWRLKKMDPKALRLEKEVLQDITRAKFMPFMRTKEKVIEDLELAGFELLMIIEDEAGRFPTFVLTRT
ncbi:hypothetical protein COB11_08060 [Candidatus Aerophobetes bacterium]|uniref:Methyltransferase domain-containing protein n=1 Tax=Aerophobetes bacterium TaxID=2030807 RepID=A0A2A4YAJ9_UNCAE|nr:MAG: hypothetical protein COB11_08060 [Candidatus Aerophobetes bacterium]